MGRNVSFRRRFFRSGVWRWLVSAVATVALGASIVPCAGESRITQEPDFSGLFRTEGVSSAPVLRDSVRGWTYFAGSGSADGVVFSQWLFRISDAGIPDVLWRLPSDFQITEQYLAPDGTPIVHAYVKKSPTFEERWYRLERESVGEVMPVEIPNSAQLPPRDSINLLQSAALAPRLLPQDDGTTIAFETIMAPAPSYALTYTLRKLDARNNVQWSAAVNTRPHNLATDARGNIYLLGKAVSISGKTANLLRVSTDGHVDATWNPSIEFDSNVWSTIRVVNDRIVIADLVSGGPPFTV